MTAEALPERPSRMRALVLDGFGGPECLGLAELPVPEPGPDDVLLRVRAAAVNPRDWMIRDGRYPFRWMLPSPPFVPGSDVAGTIVRVGRRVRGFGPGDEVLAMIPSTRGFGAFAEFVAVPGKSLARKPDGVGFAEAAALPLAGLTALQAIRDRGRFRAGGRAVVVGASGGVGHYGVQIAKALGASAVVGVCSARNAEIVRALGADRVVDYRTEPFPESLEGDEPFDLVFDAIGRHSLSSCRSILSARGAYVTTVPTLRGVVDELRTRLWPFGRIGRLVLVASKGKDLEQLVAWMASGRLRSVLDRTAPLDGFPDLLEHSRSFRTRGKNVFLLDSGPEGEAIERRIDER